MITEILSGATIMQWENLTAPDFAKAAYDTGVCILALGVLERHGEHLPLGTDYLNGHRLACLAAEKAPSIVFPPFYFGQIYEARCFPGAVALRPTLLLALLQAVLDEIGRNGFRKIILLSAHGGNDHLAPFLAQCSLWEEKPYSLYYYTGELSLERRKAWQAILETPAHGHACECESSISLANHPQLVHLERLPRGKSFAGKLVPGKPPAGTDPGEALNRLDHLPANFSGVSWYADFPEHYAGDARPANAEKGVALRQILVDAFAEYIAAVKADQMVPELEQEFFARVAAVSGQ
jgi:creatinine amidohydrolase